MLKTALSTLLILALIVAAVFYFKPVEPATVNTPDAKEKTYHPDPENSAASLPVIANFPNGSWIKCELLDPDILFRTHRGSLMRVPASSVSLLNFSDGTTKTTLKLTNGGNYSGEILVSPLHLKLRDTFWDIPAADLTSIGVTNEKATAPPLPIELQNQIAAIEKTTKTFTLNFFPKAIQLSSETLLLLDDGSQMIGETAPLDLLPGEKILSLERLNADQFRVLTDKSGFSTHTLNLTPVSVTFPWGTATLPADSLKKIIRPGSKPKPPKRAEKK